MKYLYSKQDQKGEKGKICNVIFTKFGIILRNFEPLLG